MYIGLADQKHQNKKIKTIKQETQGNNYGAPSTLPFLIKNDVSERNIPNGKISIWKSPSARERTRVFCMAKSI